MLERLHLRPELGAFEAFLRERVAFTTSFDDDRFAKVKGIERDARNGLTIISQFVAGTRLSELLEAATGLPADEATCPSVDAALGFLLEILPALGSLHEHGGHAHGTLAPGRIVLTPTSQVVALDWLYGPTIQRLQFNRRRLWSEFGVAVPTAPGLLKLDIPGDVAQASLVAMMIVLGRPLRENEYPDALGTLVSEVIEIAQIRGSSQFGSGLQAFLERTLPLASRAPHASAAEAAAEVRDIAREIGVSRCRTALTAFVDDMTRVLAEEREQAERDSQESDLLGIDAAVDELAAAMIPDLSGSDEDYSPADPSPADDPAIASTAPSFDEFDASVGVDLFEDSPAGTADSILSDPVSIPELSSSLESGSPLEIEPAPAAFAPLDLDELVPDEPSSLAEPEPIPPPVIVEPEPVIVPVPVALAPPPLPAPQPVSEPVRLQPASTASAHVEIVTPAPQEPQPASAPPAALAPPAEPTPSPAPTPPPAPAPTPQPAAQHATKAQSKRKKRGSKGHRDKLRSNAVPPAPKPAPAPPPPPAPVAIPMPTFNPVPDPFRNAPAPTPIARPQPVAPSPPAPLRLKTDTPANAPIRMKSEAASTFTPAPARMERRDSPSFGVPSFEREQADAPSNFPWKLAAAAVVGVIALIGVGRYYLANEKPSPTEAVETVPAKEPAAPEKVEAGKPGTVAITTQPAGAHVFLDGKPVGDSPVTLQNVAAGKHTLTFVTSSGTVKKPIRVEPGKGLSLEVPIYSGWIAVFSPVTLEIAENGKPIGTTEQGRLMLSPGRHTLTFSSQDMGYKTTQTVDIEPGEEASVSITATGELNANATPWAEVWMNGKKVGETPVAALRVPLGTHEVVFKNPKFPDRQVTVTVRASAPAIAFVDFTK